METMNRNILKRAKGVNIAVLVADVIAILVYLFLFVRAFIEIPVPTKEELADVNFIYNGLMISILAIFLMVSIPLVSMDIKTHKSKNDYDYDAWYAGNNFVKGLLSIALLNPVSAIIRLYNTQNLLVFSTGAGYLTAIKNIFNWIKTKVSSIGKNKDALSETHLSEEEVRLRKQIRKQTAFIAIRTILLYTFIAIAAAFVFLPFYWMMITALRTFEETQSTQANFFIALKDMQWINFKYVLNEMDFGLYIRNTLFVGVVSTIGTVVTTVLAAFAFSRISFKGRETLFSVLLMTMMIPGELYIITNFVTVAEFGWITAEGNKIFLAMIVPFMTSVFYIFFLRQTFKQIPNSLYQAAQVDGSSDLKYLFRVMIPIAGPTIFTITILSVIGSWNAFIWPRLMAAMLPNNNEQFWLISVALNRASFMDPEGMRIMYNLQIAASALVTVPLLIVFLALRKYIIRGVGRSGIKG